MRTQQDEVYAAEACVDHGARFDSQAEIQQWVDGIVAQDWWGERFDKVTVIEVPMVHRRSGAGSVGAWFKDGGGVIEMARVHWCEMFVLHEMAHVTAEAEGSHSHDPLFVRHYLELVFRVMGPEPWMALRQSLLDHGVIIDPRDDEGI